MNNSTMDEDDSFAKIYQDFAKQCDVQNFSWDKNLVTSAFLALFLIGFFCQLITFPATWRIGQRRAAFFFMLNANVGHSIELLVYIAICLEYFFVGHSVHYPLDMDTYLHSLMYSLIAFCYVMLALNRFVAVFMVMEYDKIFNPRRQNLVYTLSISHYQKRSIKLWIGICWLLGLLYSVGMNSRPELRPYHCMDQLVVVTLLSKEDLAQQSDYIVAVWMGTQYLAVFFAIVPMILYLTVLVKMVIDQCSLEASADSSTVGHQNRERVRMFLISLLSTLPYFLIFLVNKMQLLIGSLLFGFWMSFLYKSLFILFQLHQPFLMFWLSMDFRREIIRDLRIVPRLMKKNGQNSVNIQLKTILTKQAWK